MEREKIVEGYKRGIVVLNGLIAHGRGEAFDYIIGETTIPQAFDAIKVAVAKILMANHPVISVNGNTAALVPEHIVALSKETKAKIEVNLFYRTEERVNRIIEHLKSFGAEEVLGGTFVEGIPGLESERRKVDPRGILSADVVLVMLEDGDRTEYLKKMGKTVIAIDLNPFSRTAMKADITIMDNVTRALPLMVELAKKLKNYRAEELKKLLEGYNNNVKLAEYVEYINNRLKELATKLNFGDKS